MDDADDYSSGATEPPPTLRLDADNGNVAPAAGARSSAGDLEYDGRYDSRPGDAAMDEQARQWDSRYDGLAIGSSIGGDDQ